MGITEIEAVARTIAKTSWPSEEHYWQNYKNNAQAAIQAYESTPRQQARQAVVEAVLEWHKSPQPLGICLSRLAELAVRLAELESGDG